MGGKSAPPPPDYTAAAAQQAESSRQNTLQQTWANRPEQITPWGGTHWTSEATTDPGTGEQVTKWTQTQTLDPKLQSALDQQLGLQSQRSDLAGSFMSRVADEMGSHPFDWDKINANTPAAKAVDASGYTTRATGAQTSVPTYQMDTSAPKQLTSGKERIGLTGQDTSKIGPTTQTTDELSFSDQRNRIEQQLFDRMQPQHDRQQAALETQLANQGITRGSEAYDHAMQQLGDQQSRERYDAMQTGGQEQQRMQQELLGQQQQAFAQAGTSQQQQNAALQQLFNQYQQQGQFALSAQQQGFGQDTASAQAGNAAKQAMFNQMLQAGQFKNQGLQQEFAQSMGANAQNFGQAQSAANQEQQFRQQAIAEEAQRRNMSLNEMNALLTGQQVQSPNMPGFQNASKADTTEYLKAAGMTGQAQQDAFNAQQQQTQGMMSGLMGLGSGAMMM